MMYFRFLNSSVVSNVQGIIDPLFLTPPQATEQGLGSSVCTLYEIHSGEYSSETEFHNMEPWMLKKAILALAKQGKAEYIPGTTPDDSDAGVKFFS